MFEVVTCVFIYFIPQNDSCTRCWLFCTHLSLVHSFPNLESTPHLDSLDSVTFLKAPSRKRHPGLEKEREKGIYKTLNSAHKSSLPLTVYSRIPVCVPDTKVERYLTLTLYGITHLCLLAQINQEGKFKMESSHPCFDDQTPKWCMITDGALTAILVSGCKQ